MRYLVLALALLCSACDQEAPQQTMVIRGKLSALSFCEGDDGTVSASGGRLIIDCADRHKIPIRVTGDGLTIRNMDLDCDNWCEEGVDVTGSNGTIEGLLIVRTGRAFTTR